MIKETLLIYWCTRYCVSQNNTGTHFQTPSSWCSPEEMFSVFLKKHLKTQLLCVSPLRLIPDCCFVRLPRAFHVKWSVSAIGFVMWWYKTALTRISVIIKGNQEHEFRVLWSMYISIGWWEMYLLPIIHTGLSLLKHHSGLRLITVMHSTERHNCLLLATSQSRTKNACVQLS